MSNCIRLNFHQTALCTYHVLPQNQLAQTGCASICPEIAWPRCARMMASLEVTFRARRARICNMISLSVDETDILENSEPHLAVEQRGPSGWGVSSWTAVVEC